MLTGLAEFAVCPRIISAPRQFWNGYAASHIDKVIKKIMDTSSHGLNCVICGVKYSVHYKTSSSLFSHYKTHKAQCIQYYFERLFNEPEIFLTYNDQVKEEQRQRSLKTKQVVIPDEFLFPVCMQCGGILSGVLGILNVICFDCRTMYRLDILPKTREDVWN